MSRIGNNYLRRDVVRRAAEGTGEITLLDALFAHAEVGETTVTLGVEKNVVEFEIAAMKRLFVRFCDCLNELEEGNSANDTIKR